MNRILFLKWLDDEIDFHKKRATGEIGGTDTEHHKIALQTTKRIKRQILNGNRFGADLKYLLCRIIEEAKH